jgi:hypothetical protein
MLVLPPRLLAACTALAVLNCVAASTCAADLQSTQPWTVRDLNAVVETAIRAAASGTSKSAAISTLEELARRLRSIGDIPRAKSVLEKAAELLDAPNDFVSSNSREKIIEELVALGSIGLASNLADVDTAMPARMAFLGKLGVGLAKAGNIVEAKRTVVKIVALSSTATADAETRRAANRAIAQTGMALLDVKASNEALELLPMLSNRVAEVQLLAAGAGTLCRADTGSAGDSQRGQELLQQALDKTRPALGQIEPTYADIGFVASVAQAVAKCKGPDDAKVFISDTLGPQKREGALNNLQNALMSKGEVDIVKFLLPRIDDGDPHILFLTADRLMRFGYRSEARRYALQAAHVASIGDTTRRLGLLASIGKLLIDLSEYDAAIAIIQPTNTSNKLQYYTQALEAEIKARDAAGIAHTLPAALSIFKEAAESGVRVIEDLVRVTRAFARAKYAEESQQCFDLLQVIALPQPMRFNRLASWEMAVLRADMGDVQGGLVAAEESGPLTTGPDAAQVMALMAMNMAGVQNPTEQQIAEGLKSAKAALTRMAGPKARALSAIATDMAARGDIEAAWQAEKGLEGEESNEVAGLRDVALGAIAEAQTRTGDLRSAFATITRMTGSKSQWYSLLELIRPPTEP